MSISSSKPKLLVVSHVLPFPGNAGQQLRVRYMLEAALSRFEVDFLTSAPRGGKQEVHDRLSSFDCRPIILESRLNGSGIRALPSRLAAGLFVLCTGLKSSNYSIGKVELSPTRIREAVRSGRLPGRALRILPRDPTAKCTRLAICFMALSVSVNVCGIECQDYACNDEAGLRTLILLSSVFLSGSFQKRGP